MDISGCRIAYWIEHYCCLREREIVKRERERDKDIGAVVIDDVNLSQ